MPLVIRWIACFALAALVAACSKTETVGGGYRLVTPESFNRARA